jgi:DNA transformation protein
MSPEPADELSAIRNIGPKTMSWLHAVGIHTQADLEDLGAVEAYKRLKAAFPHKVTLNALYGLQGAILNIHWNALPPDMKADLKAQVTEHSE